LFAFRHKEKKAYIRDTVFILSKPCQLLSYHNPKLFKWYEILPEIKRRCISLRVYEICKVRKKEVK
jgi:hypothetical protein